MPGKLFEKGSPVRFVAIFLALFLVFYYFNIVFFGITSPGNNYNAFLAEHLNYIRAFRHLLLNITMHILNAIGYTAITSDYDLLLVGHGTLRLDYSCLGLGVMSFFLAFIIAYPRRLKSKIIFAIAGILAIQTLNILRFVLLALFWNKHAGNIIDHHAIFNGSIYVIIAITLYLWVKSDDKKPSDLAKN